MFSVKKYTKGFERKRKPFLPSIFLTSFESKTTRGPTDPSMNFYKISFKF